MLNQKIRYSVINKFIKDLQGKQNLKIRICEIGSGSQGMGPYIRNIKFIGVDKDFKDYSAARENCPSNMEAVCADAKKLPFKANSFDLVFSLDMIEHIRPDDRPKVIKEMIRISNKLIVVGFPAGVEAYKTDLKQAIFMRKHFGEMPGWLEEHLTIAYPQDHEIGSILENLGYKYELFGNESVTVHKIIQFIEMLPFSFSSLLDKATPFNVANFLGKHGSNFYREIYVINKNSGITRN